MKRHPIFCLSGLALFLLLFLLSTSAQAQRRRPNEPANTDNPFADKLWYGGFFGLGFGGTGFSSTFSINLSPMVGYKVLPPLSLGPRLGVQYTYQKFQGVRAFNLFDFEIALFVRVHVFRGFFLHGELGSRSDNFIEFDGVNYTIFRRGRPVQNLGAGYNFSRGRGGFGQEVAILYDFYIGGDINTFENPWQYRFAITYGF